MSSVNVTQNLWNKSFILCLANNLFLFIFYFAQTAILPVYIVGELNGTLAQAGLAMTLFMASSIAVRPFSGLIIEKFGRKKTLFVSEGFFCLLSFAYLLADDLTLLLVIRFIHGIWFSILTTVAVPVVSDFIPENRKGEGMGYFVMSINLGIVLGPLIGLSMIQSIPYTEVAAVLAAVVCLGYIFCFIIPVSDSPQHSKIQKSLSIQDFVEIKALPVALLAMIIAFSYASIMSFISTFTESKNLLEYASLFFVVFAVSMMSLRPFTGKLYDRKGASYVIYPAIALFSAGLVALSQVNSITGLMVAAVLIGTGFGSVQPCLQTLAIQCSPKHRIGHATSTYFTLYDLGIAVGSIVLGSIISSEGYTFTYLLCAAVTASGMLFYKFFVGKRTA